MVYRRKISDIDQLKRVHIDCCDNLSKFGKEYLNSLKCEFCIFFSIKFRKFWHTARLSRTNRHNVIKSEKQSGFLAHPAFLPTTAERIALSLSCLSDTQVGVLSIFFLQFCPPGRSRRFPDFFSGRTFPQRRWGRFYRTPSVSGLPQLVTAT